VFALVERHVGDFAEAGAVMVQCPDIGPVHFLGTAIEVISAVRGKTREHHIDLSLGGDERVQSGGVGLGHGCLQHGVGDITALVGMEIKFNETVNIGRTFGQARVAWVLHGGDGNSCKGLETLGNVLFCVATQ